MPGLAFYFLSILLRFILLALGLLGVAIFWKSLSGIIWPEQIYPSQTFVLTDNLPASISTIRIGIGAVYGVLLLLSAAVASCGAWLIYQRLRRGLSSPQVRAPESGLQRIVTAGLYGFFGLLFTYLSMAFVANFAKTFYTAAYAVEAQAIVTGQGVAKNPVTGFAGKTISFEFKLPNNATETTQSFVSLRHHNNVSIGDTIRVLYWPDRPQLAQPAYKYEIRSLGFPFFKTILFVALALVGVSGFWECVKFSGKNRPKPQKPSNHDAAPPKKRADRAGFGRRQPKTG